MILYYHLVNCVWGTWNTWATCSQTCGGLGVQVRTRKVTTHEENGGTACTELSTEQQNCNVGVNCGGKEHLLSIFVTMTIFNLFVCSNYSPIPC